MLTERHAALGLTGERHPIGAVLRVGRKDPESGAPIDRDCFYVVSQHTEKGAFRTRAGKTYNAPHRVKHPHFEFYNNTPPEKRRAFRGMLMHRTMDSCWSVEWRADAGQLGGDYPKHPSFRPSCKSFDGKTATRLYQLDGKGARVPAEAQVIEGTPDDETWCEIPCPGEACKYRQGDKKRCHVASVLLFVPRWIGAKSGDYPTPLMAWYTGSGSSADRVASFFKTVGELAEGEHIEDFSLTGLPFTLEVAEVTSQKKGRVFPVVSMTPDISDIVGFLGSRKAAAELAGLSPEVHLLTSADDLTEEDVTVHVEEVTPRVPGQGNLEL